MTSYNVVFDEKQYRAIANKAAKYYQEKAKSDAIPLIQASVFDAKEYTHIDLSDLKANTKAGVEHRTGQFADVIHEPTTIDLYSYAMTLHIDPVDIANYGQQLIADKKDASIEKWILDVDDAVYHGPKDDNSNQLAEGLIGQLTSIENLDGTDSLLDTKGDLWTAFNTMIDGIPYAMREEGPPMLCYVSEGIVKHADAPSRIYLDGKTEWQYILEHLRDQALPARKIGSFHITNKILAEATDDTDGENADTVDTEGTHDRILLMVPDKRWVGRVVSRGFDLYGEDVSNIYGVTQLWVTRRNAYFFNTDCAEYSEAITWS